MIKAIPDSHYGFSGSISQAGARLGMAAEVGFVIPGVPIATKFAFRTQLTLVSSDCPTSLIYSQLIHLDLGLLVAACFAVSILPCP
eukprot:COSAG05_NODE_568_length_8638_cov_8.593395_4_plen_86_part_00